MKQILDAVLIGLLVFLAINLFTGQKEEATLSSGNIIISASDNSYSIPADVQLEIENLSPDTLSIDSCQDIAIKFRGTPITLPETTCTVVEVLPGKKEMIDYGEVYTSFMDVGSYFVQLTLDEKEYISSFDIENRGSIGKLFVHVFYAPLYNLVMWLSYISAYSLGWAIIMVTIIIRLLLLWPQHKMMVSQRKLQAIQPKIKALQEKFKGNQQQLGMELMNLYKKEKVNPMGSCGFLIIQLPILLVIYNIIFNIRDASSMYYLYNSLSSFDLSMLSYDFYGLDLLGAGGLVGLGLALLVGGIQFMQIKLSLNFNAQNTKTPVLEKKKGANDYSSLMPDPNMMNKFMLYGMPIMVMIFTYTLFAGIGLYWAVSTLFMIFQQIVVNKIVKK